MEQIHAGLLLLLFSSVYSYQYRSRAGYGLFVQDPELEWERMETVIGEGMVRAPAPATKYATSSSGSSVPEARKVPEYRVVSKDQKEIFKPEKTFRPLPNSVQELLRGATVAPSVATGRAVPRPPMIEVLCHVDRMYVRILREYFKNRDAYKHLKLGTCPVNQGTKKHYYLLYLLKNDCAFQTESNVNDLYISNVLRYNPAGPVLREIAFDIPLRCKYPRFFHSFKVGFYPKLQGGTVFKALTPKNTFTLTPQDASGNELSGAKTFILGKPMFFEAKRAEGTAKSSAQRIYINKCFMTASQDPNSNLRYTVIDNQGCMIDGKVSLQSAFVTGPSKMVQKFKVGALIFKDKVASSSTQQLYMHCEIVKGQLTPTPSLKACNYDPDTKKWKELYGDDYVCTCCDSTCTSSQPKASRNMISSPSWKIDLSSQDEDVEFEPQMKYFDADTFNLEDPDMAEHKDFLSYWEHDY